MSYNICSYNLGLGRSDYSYLLDYNNIPRTEEDMKNPVYHHFIKDRNGEKIAHYASRERYEKIEKVAADAIGSSADVFFLQEVQHTGRELVKNLKERNFTCMTRPRNDVQNGQRKRFDNMIALSKERFQDIKNHSRIIEITPEFSKDVAIATAVDKQTKRKIAFVSLHVPGFDFAAEGQELRQKAKDGDVYCEKILEEVEKIQGVSQIVFGGDFNANPEKWENRFNIFKDKGYKLVRTNRSTGVYTRNGERSTREIDFFFIRDVLEGSQSTINAKPLDHFNWTSHEENSSDHGPIILEVGALKVAQPLHDGRSVDLASSARLRKPRNKQKISRMNKIDSKKLAAGKTKKTTTSAKVKSKKVQAKPKKSFFLKTWFTDLFKWVKKLFK